MGVVRLGGKVKASGREVALVGASVVGDELGSVGFKLATVISGQVVDLALLTAVVVGDRDGSLPVDPPAAGVTVCFK